LKEARDHHISVRVMTNSMATTDEPLASLAYERYRLAMLKMGIDLYELRPLVTPADQRNGPGASRGRWHAKMAFIDRKTTVLGSMNLDQRSATTNTELVLLIQSPEFANRALTTFNAARNDHVYQVRLRPNDESLQWVSLKDAGGTEVRNDDPDVDYLLRLKLFLLSPFVSEDLL
jgi:phosphatidylserine/phosphatidylglycerophosphate/cardiolipin synthase-like enzyme